MSWCLMNEVTMDLTDVASFSVSDSVTDHLRPVIPTFSESIFELWTRLVSSSHTIMSLFECLLCLFM